MANKYCNLDGTKKIKDEFGKISQGFSIVEQDVNQVENKSVILDDKIDNQINTVNNTINTNVDTLNNRIDNQINTVNTRIDEIITTPAEGVSAQEIIDARQGEISLGAKISVIDHDVKNRVKVVLSETEPISPQDSTWWYKIISDSPNLDNGGGGLLVGNANIEEGNNVWFQEI